MTEQRRVRVQWPDAEPEYGTVSEPIPKTGGIDVQIDGRPGPYFLNHTIVHEADDV